MTKKIKTNTVQRDIEKISLKRGKHRNSEEGMCVMEAVAYIAGEPHSDHPKCADRAITSALIRLNDRMPDDATRDKYLKPIIPQIVGTVSTQEVYIKRGFVAADFAVRISAPLVMDMLGKTEYATKLRALAPLIDRETSVKARDFIRQTYPYRLYSYYAAAAAAANAAAAAADAAADAAAAAVAAEFKWGSGEYRAVRNAEYKRLYALYSAKLDRAKLWQAGVDMVKAMIAVKEG